MNRWMELPKVELHLHLEGAMPPDFLRRLAGEKGIDLSRIFDAAGAYKYTGFADFLRVYEAACEVLQTPGDYQRLIEAVLEQSHRQGVVYTEIFVSPDFCGGGDEAAWNDYLAALKTGIANAQETFGIVARIIVTCVRHFGPDQARKVAQLSANTASDILVGFGMGGDETFGSTADFAPAFALAGEAGLRLTAHAGEFDGPGSVSRCLDHLRVERIGHGVRAVEDGDLVRRLADEAIVLEICPGSNIALGVFADWRSHPIDRLQKSGVRVTVSTDDPPFFHTDMAREFSQLEQVFGWNEADMQRANTTAIEAAFCDAETKTDILNFLARK